MAPLWEAGMPEMDMTLGEVGRTLQRIEKSMVTQAEFQPVARIVYGLCGVLLLGVIGALVKVVLIK